MQNPISDSSSISNDTHTHIRMCAYTKCMMRYPPLAELISDGILIFDIDYQLIKANVSII